MMHGDAASVRIFVFVRPGCYSFSRSLLAPSPFVVKAKTARVCGSRRRKTALKVASCDKKATKDCKKDGEERNKGRVFCER
jgi:hypothetical protein